MGVTYFGLYYIIPKLLLQRRYIPLLVVSILTMTIGGVLQRLLVYYSSIPLLGLSNPHASLFDPTEILNHIINTNAVMIVPFAIKLYSYSLEKENRILALSQEKTNAELSLLRSQIQPHFFFNVLNDLYAMALKKSDKTADMILHLSDMMRYVLKDSSADFVPLEKELNYMGNYMELEKLRYGNRLTVDSTITGDVSGLVIAPLLLLPFVENAFKHSATRGNTGDWIRIETRIEDSVLTLLVSNSYDPDARKPDYLSSGIGIKNVCQRLDILYPGQHSFSNNATQNSYNSKLTINLTKWKQ